jgi:hypothetical protein
MQRFVILLAVVLCLVFAVPSFAQSVPAFEFFGGFSHTRVPTTVLLGGGGGGGGGGDLGCGNTCAIRVSPGDPQFGPPGTSANLVAHLNGWNSSVAANFTKWFGAVAEFGGSYGSPQVSGTTVNLKVHSFLFGPRVSIRKFNRVVPFVHALFGVAHARGEVLGISATDNAIAMSFGGGVDVKLTDHVYLRAAQLDYLRTQLFDEHQNNFRISAGVVFRFGSK